MERTTYAKLEELQKRELITRITSLFHADEKAFKVLMYHLELEEQRLKENNVKVAKTFP